MDTLSRRLALQKEILSRSCIQTDHVYGIIAVLMPMTLRLHAIMSHGKRVTIIVIMPYNQFRGA